MSDYTLATISMTLDKRSITRAIEEVRRVERRLRAAMNEFCEVLLEEGVSMARIEVIALGAIDTGGLLASIGHGAYDPATHTGVIYAGAYYAFFVEYGTGIVGAENPHPAPESAGTGSGGNLLALTYGGYDSGGHGQEGWIYRSDVDGKLHWTRGMKSRPFMYNTMKYLKDYAEREGGRTIASFTIGGG